MHFLYQLVQRFEFHHEQIHDPAIIRTKWQMIEPGVSQNPAHCKTTIKERVFDCEMTIATVVIQSLETHEPYCIINQ